MNLLPKNYPDFITDGPPPCSEVDPDLFFPIDHDDPEVKDSRMYEGSRRPIYPVSVRHVKKICEPCPYKQQCLVWALKHNEPGVWGGTSEIDRIRMKKEAIRARYRHTDR